MARPAHPGQFIRIEVIEPLGLSVTDAAKVLGVTRPALSALLNCRAALSADMAIRIEKAFGPKMDTLLRMQTAIEIAEARERQGDIKVKRYVAKRRRSARCWRERDVQLRRHHHAQRRQAVGVHGDPRGDA